MSDIATVSIDDRIRIEHACTRLAVDYSFYADSKDMEAWSKVFAEDATMVLWGQSHNGRAAILKSVTSAPAGPEMATFHSNSNIRIDVVSPTEARGTVWVTVFMVPLKDGAAAAKDLSPGIVGQYRDVYKKTGEGWKIARREFVPTLTRAQA